MNLGQLKMMEILTLSIVSSQPITTDWYEPGSTPEYGARKRMYIADPIVGQ
jgi:hypothetical protein